MGHFGAGEIIAILIILVLIFGANRLPQIGEGFGKAIKNFKRGLSNDDDIKVSSDKQIPSDSSAKNINTDGEQAQDGELVERTRKHDDSV